VVGNGLVPVGYGEVPGTGRLTGSDGDGYRVAELRLGGESDVDLSSGAQHRGVGGVSYLLTFSVMLNLDAEGARRTAVDERWVEDYEVAVQDVVGHVPSTVPVALDVPVDQYRAGRRLVSLSNYHRSRGTEQEDG